MATNNINKSISGVYGGHLLTQLHVLLSVIPQTKNTLKFPPPFTKIEEKFLRELCDDSQGSVFLSIIDHTESMVRIVDTPNKRGIILTIPKVLELVSSVSFARTGNEFMGSDDYTWRTQKPERVCYKLLDIVVFLKESGCNIIELVSSKHERDILRKISNRSYYSSKYQIPKLFIPLLSSRYTADNFTKLAQTSYYSLLTKEQQTRDSLDVRCENFNISILRNEVLVVRNEETQSLQVLEV
jgi:hypothetical protein